MRPSSISAGSSRDVLHRDAPASGDRRRRALRTLAALTGVVVFGACASEMPQEDPTPPADPGLLELVKSGQPVFGVFSGEKSMEQGRTMMESSDADFILYSMESGPFDVAGMEVYMDGMEAAGGPTALEELPVVLRVPPIDDEAATSGQLDAALPTGIAGIVFPHVARPDQAAASARLMDTAWPADPQGVHLNILIVEDIEGIENIDEIMSTPGLSVVFAGPGDLRRAYEGDMEAVETAIQTVLAACKEFDVVCGVTAGVDDIAGRLEEGWGMIIVTQPEAVAVGLEASGRAG